MAPVCIPCHFAKIHININIVYGMVLALHGHDTICMHAVRH